LHLPVSVEEEYPYPPPDCAYNSLHAFPVVHILKQLKKIYKKKMVLLICIITII